MAEDKDKRSQQDISKKDLEYTKDSRNGKVIERKDGNFVPQDGGRETESGGPRKK